jgi:C-terminal processing protease CtpA/Prc
VEAALRTADPEARILPADAATALTNGVTVETFEEWPDGIGYLKLNGAYGKAGDAAPAVQAWAAAGERAGLIVDLRGAAGSSVSAIDEIAGVFVAPDAPLYTVRDGAGQNAEPHRAVPAAPRLPATMPVMVLVDEETADGAEVLAAVLRSRRGVMLLGRRTRGSGRLREVIRLDETEALYIGTHWVEFEREDAGYGPGGLSPDIEVAADGSRAFRPSPRERSRDGGPLSTKAQTSRELSLRIRGDPVAGRAADILLGLRALDVAAGAAGAGVPNADATAPTEDPADPADK